MDIVERSTQFGSKIQFITSDSWYPWTENLKTIIKYGIRFIFGIDSNSKVSPKKGQLFQIYSLPNFH